MAFPIFSRSLMGRILRELARLLAVKTADGALAYSRADIEDVLVAELLDALPGTSPDATPPQVAHLLASFCRRVGIAAELAPEQALAAADAYFVAHPVRGDLKASLNAFAREVAVWTQDDAGRKRATDALLGRCTPARDTNRAAADGTLVRATPLARFALGN